MTGSQFAAGRSYQGVEASPCMEGSRKGASLDRADDAIEVPACTATAPFDSVLLALGPFVTASRN